MTGAYLPHHWLYFKKQKRYAKAALWPALFVYLHLGANWVLFAGSCAILFGFVNLSARLFLNLFGLLVPATAVTGFVVSLASETPKDEKLYPSVAIQVWTWVGVALLSCIWVGLMTAIHVALNGSKNSLQPLEMFSDVGTTYFFAVSSALVVSVSNVYLALGVVYAYCNDLFYPSEITLVHSEVVRIKDD